VPAGTNRVDRPYQHRVDVECATPAACREADMSVKACNGSDGQDATVEAPGRRLRIGYVAVSFTLAAPFTADVAHRARRGSY
jgi:hypothetical protein